MKTSTVTERKIALQMVHHVVEPEQVLYSQPDGDGELVFSKGDPTEGGIPLFVQTEDPESPFFATVVSNAGMLQRRAYPEQTYVGLAKRIDTENGVEYEYVNKLVYDGRGMEVTVKARGNTSQLVFSIAEADYLRLLADDVLVVPHSEIGVLRMWEPGYGTSSQTRKAEMVVKSVDIPYHEYFRRIGFNPALFLTPDKKRPGYVTVKSVDKMSKRVKQTASSSKPRAFMVDYRYKGEEEVTYTVFRGTPEEETVMATRICLVKEGTDEEVFVLLAPDFLVRQEVELVVPAFPKSASTAIRMERVKQVVDKAATDGSHLFDRDFAFQNGMADGNDLRAGEHFRWGAPVKGFAFLFPGLVSLTGYVAILFDGGIKGDARVAFRDFPMDFAVLTRGRKSEEFPSLKLSRQVLSAIQYAPLLSGLEADTNSLIERVLSFDEESVRKFLSISDETGVEEGGFSGEREVDVDQLTTRLYAVGRKTFLKSHTMKKKLADLLRAALEKFGRGSSLYLEDASFKHMMVDPWTIVQYMRQGVLGVDETAEEQVGVKPHHVLVSGLKRDAAGQLVHHLDTREVALFRFPFLHEYEARKVNIGGDNPFGDERAQAWYQYLAKSGQLQGLIFYSLWDMNPEAQSGADFDGDQTLVTANPHVVDSLRQQPYFLDYSLVEQADGSWELISGCPFPGEARSLEPFLSDQDRSFIQANGVELAGDGLSLPEDVARTPAAQDLIGKLGAAVARAGLVPNDIGSYTNINSTIFNIISVLDKHLFEIAALVVKEGMQPDLMAALSALTEEKLGYERLSLFLAVAIRWEIDKAKHGGAYRAHMPFLEALDGRMDAGELADLEDTFGVSLQRLLLGERQIG